MGKYGGFQSVQLTRPQRSTFDLSHTKRLTVRAGYLTPVLCAEAVPGDSWYGSSEILVRLAPLLAPIYDELMVFVHFFFVPNRLLWEEWETFITAGRLGGPPDPAAVPTPPYYDIGACLTALPTAAVKNSLADYLGVPLLLSLDSTAANWNGHRLAAMPILAYQLACTQYYRDRNFVSDDMENSFPRPSGALTTYGTDFDLQIRNWMHDYFHSALPFTQRGTEVLIPMEASVTYLRQSIVKRSDTGAALNNYDLLLGTQSTSSYPPGTMGFSNDLGATEQTAGRIENIDNISNGTSTINDFRTAYALQVWYERNAVAGSRYTESIQAHFGVRPQDSRLQRAEFLGGGRIPIKISEVVSTAWSNDGSADVPLANLAGHGVTYGNTNKFSYFVSEHGFILGILSIMSPPSYHQGLPRMFVRPSFLSYPWPTFAKLGEQEVHKFELYCTPANLTPDADGNPPLFGYQSRYADWKWLQNSSHGDFHDSLLFWTLTQDFSSSPTLNASFNKYDVGIQDRIFAVSGTNNFWCYLHNKLTVKRCLPYYGSPNNLGFQ